MAQVKHSNIVKSYIEFEFEQLSSLVKHGGKDLKRLEQPLVKVLECGDGCCPATCPMGLLKNLQAYSFNVATIMWPTIQSATVQESP